MEGNIMIDTIVLALDKINIDNQKSLDMAITAKANSKTICVVSNCICNHLIGSGEDIHGKELRISSEEYYLKVKPDIAFLTPRLHRILNLPHNLNSLTKDQVKKAFDHLDKELKEYGIYCDLYKSKLSVLHLMKNIYLDRPYECYDRLFESLNAKKMKKFHHDHSWYFDNTLRQIIIYDKARQLKEKKRVSLDKHIMRIEYRLKKKQKITYDLEYDTLESLINNWDNLENIYIKKVSELLFANAESADGNQKRNKLDEMLYFQDNIKSRWFNEYLLANGAERVLEKTGDISALKRELVQNTAEVSTSRYIDRFQKYLFKSQASNKYGSTIGELYQEIKSKFFGPVQDYLDDRDVNIYNFS